MSSKAQQLKFSNYNNKSYKDFLKGHWVKSLVKFPIQRSQIIITPPLCSHALFKSLFLLVDKAKISCDLGILSRIRETMNFNSVSLPTVGAHK